VDSAELLDWLVLTSIEDDELADSTELVDWLVLGTLEDDVALDDSLELTPVEDEDELVGSAELLDWLVLDTLDEVVGCEVTAPHEKTSSLSPAPQLSEDVPPHGIEQSEVATFVEDASRAEPHQHSPPYSRPNIV
jgi:hypothetical protein